MLSDLFRGSSPRKRGPITTGLWNMDPRFRGDDSNVDLSCYPNCAANSGSNSPSISTKATTHGAPERLLQA